MRQNNKISFKPIHHIFLIFVIALGLITIVATGGGDGEGTHETDQRTTEPGPETAPAISNLVWDIGCG